MKRELPSDLVSLTAEEADAIGVEWSQDLCGWKWKWTEVKESEVSSIKHDEGKPRWDLVPFEAMERIVEIIGYGTAKYGENTWQCLENGDDRYFAAAMRHLVNWRAGDVADPESGKSHLAHAACNLLYLIHRSEVI